MTNKNNNANRFFENAWICVTGASGGMGRCFALEFARHGGNLILGGRDVERLMEVQDACQAYDVECVPVVGDLTDGSAREALEDRCIERQIDILVNNAGIVRVETLESVAPDDIDKLIATNLAVPIKLTRAVLPMFKQRKSGTIVMVNSTVGRKPMLHQSVYCATKYGLHGFSETIRLETRQYGIRVLSVNPGKTATGIFETAGCSIDQSTHIPPQDVAQGVVAVLQLSEKSAPTELTIERFDREV
ncbi:MAG: SDR family oxidoreductase [Phycisphaerae bacterium]|nr:SDR family oxidoreductase [Phycisphaerae bacterium]